MSESLITFKPHTRYRLTLEDPFGDIFATVIVRCVEVSPYRVTFKISGPLDKLDFFRIDGGDSWWFSEDAGFRIKSAEELNDES